MTIPRLLSPARHGRGPIREPRIVTTVLAEVIGAPRESSDEFSGQARRIP